MKKYRYAVVGGGWRAEFYLRLANFLPDRFEVSSVYLRSPEKYPDLAARYQVEVVTGLEEMYASQPEFVILCADRANLPGLIQEVAGRGFYVLTETPPAADVAGLNRLWQEIEGKTRYVQVAEQYFLQPAYAALQNVVQSGRLGNVQTVSLNILHDYHAVSMARILLGVNMEDALVEGRKYPLQVVRTDGRKGFVYDGQKVETSRLRGSIAFANGKYLFYDFNGEQYHSMILGRNLQVQGSRGEVQNLRVRYLNEDNAGVEEYIRREERGPFNNLDYSHQGFWLGAEKLYSSPYPTDRLNDDEIAIACLLERMGECARGGAEVYPLQQALQDSYLSFLMHKSAESDGQVLESSPQSWIK